MAHILPPGHAPSGLDVQCAKKGERNMRKKLCSAAVCCLMLFLTACGVASQGSVGALAGMKVFHHKTRKPKFKTGVPAILIIQLIIYFLFSGNEGIILRL